MEDNVKPIKVVWTSHRPMMKEQIEDLEMFFGEPVEVENRGIYWLCTEDAQGDLIKNTAFLNNLSKEFDFIAGLFPSIAYQLFAKVRARNILLPIVKSEIDEMTHMRIPKHYRWEILGE